MGRHKDTGAPLGRRREHDAVDLRAEHAGALAIPARAHVRVAAPETHGGKRILRRGYSYSAGVDTSTGQIDAGLVFICFQRDPHTQFVAIQERLSRSDALTKHLLHTGGAVFAIPPGARRGGFLGEQLFS